MPIYQELHNARDALFASIEKNNASIKRIAQKENVAERVSEKYNLAQCSQSIDWLEPKMIPSYRTPASSLNIDGVKTIINDSVSREEEYMKGAKISARNVDDESMKIALMKQRNEITSAIVMDADLPGDLITYFKEISSTTKYVNPKTEETATFESKCLDACDILSRHAVEDGQTPKSVIIAVAASDCADMGVSIKADEFCNKLVKAVNSDLSGASENLVEEIGRDLLDVAKNANNPEIKTAISAVSESLAEISKSFANEPAR